MHIENKGSRLLGFFLSIIATPFLVIIVGLIAGKSKTVKGALWFMLTIAIVIILIFIAISQGGIT